MALTVLSLEIPADQSLSGALDCSSGRLVRIITPDAWTTAPISFQTSVDGTTFSDLYHVQIITGGFAPFEVTVPVIPGSALLMPPDVGFSIGWLKVRSGTRTKPVNQAATRKFILVFESNI
jgi:hypothetical protein